MRDSNYRTMIYDNNKLLTENNNLITYLDSIDYVRILPEVLPQLENIIRKNNGELLESFIEKQIDEERTNSKFRKVNPDKFDAFYNNKRLHLSLPFRLLARIIENQKNYFSRDKLLFDKSTSLSSNQGSLFDLEKVEIEETNSAMNCPSMIIIGQKQEFFKYSSDTPSVNFLDYTNILRITNFFERGSWTIQSIIQQLREITQKDFFEMKLYNRRYFIKFHELIEKPNVTREEIENLIWSISDYDWKTYNYSDCSLWFDEFQRGVKEIIQFFRNCIKFKNHVVIMRHNFFPG